MVYIVQLAVRKYSIPDIPDPESRYLTSLHVLTASMCVYTSFTLPNNFHNITHTHKENSLSIFFILKTIIF